MGESQKRKLTTQKKELRIGETDEDGNVITESEWSNISS